MRRLRGLVTWQVAGPIAAYMLVALLVALYFGLFVALKNGQERALDSRAAATRRIDMLQSEIYTLQARLRHTQVRDAQERGRLEDAIKALAAQIRQMGGQPVTTGGAQPSGTGETPPAPHPSPTGQPSGHPTAIPTATPQPSASPSPTCLHVPAIDRRICVS